MKKELEQFLNPMAAKLNVLVAYENLVYGIEALNLCDRLGRSLAPKCELQLTFWSLSALQLPLLSHLSQREAVETDLVVVAVDGGAALPARILNWLRRWARRRHSIPGALAAQFHGILKIDQPVSPAYGSLKEIADDSNLKLFSEVLEPSGDYFGESFASIHQRAHMAPAMEAILQFP